MFCDKPDIAALQEKLLGALIGLARATDGNEHLITPSSTAVLVDGLLAAVGNDGADSTALHALLHRVETKKRSMVPNCFECACPCERTSDYDLSRLHNAGEETRRLKYRLLSGIREIAALPARSKAAEDFLYKALIITGMEDFPLDALQNLLREMEEIQ